MLALLPKPGPTHTRNMGRMGTAAQLLYWNGPKLHLAAPDGIAEHMTYGQSHPADGLGPDHAPSGARCTASDAWSAVPAPPCAYARATTKASAAMPAVVGATTDRRLPIPWARSRRPARRRWVRATAAAAAFALPRESQPSELPGMRIASAAGFESCSVLRSAQVHRALDAALCCWPG